jgi:2,4-dienoyl-CoA reductase-like NADH-dependent reductase (Old Yellow Enzyme family)/thioredoxin reductase
MSDAAPSAQRTNRGEDPLLRPFQIKGLKLRNRIISTSHASMLDDGGLPLERYQRYHEEKARGGLAMTMFGGSAMTSPDSSWGGGQINVSTDDVIPHFQSLAMRVHGRGAALMCQISHLGRRASAFTGNWLPAVAPSRVREKRNRNFPKEMDIADINRIVRDYGAAALRCKEGGLDGLETVTGGHLIGQFLSPRTNLRTDGFGGSLENRARFGLMVHEEIRRRVGPDMVVGIRFVIDEAIEEGLSFDECLQIARIFEREGGIDFFNCIFGLMDTELALAEHNMPGMFQPDAPFLSKVGEFKKETRLPVFHAAGIRDIATARYAISENLVDMVGMTRAHIADPQIVNKLVRGEENRIRPCVGATYCMYKKVNCIHNAASGRETTMPHVIERSEGLRKKIVVVGGGPAGLEAARVSAERGHDVVILEAGNKLGGQINTAARVEGRKDLVGIVEWRAIELERLGVSVHLNVYADADMILAEKPDVVIIATGGIPDLEWLEGAEFCDNVWDVLTGIVPAKENVLVYDGTGRHAGVSCALHLATIGADVSLVTLDDALATEMPYPDRVTFRKLFAQNAIAFTIDHSLVRVARGGNGLVATLRHELTGVETQMPAAQIVVENGTTPVDDLFHELRARSSNNGITDVAQFTGGHREAQDVRRGDFALHRIGDSVSSRDIHSAIYDALRLCAEI